VEIARQTSREFDQIVNKGIASPERSPSVSTSPSPRLDLEDLYCILQLTPHDTWIARELARRLRARRRALEAVRILKQVVSLDFGVETLMELAEAEYEADLLEDSHEHILQALSVSLGTEPNLFDGYKLLGNIQVRQGDWEGAEESYNRALRLRPASDALQVNLGTLHIQRGNWQAAIDKFRAAIVFNRTNDKAWVGLAIGHRMCGDHELAWGNVEAALTYNPTNEAAITLAIQWGLNHLNHERRVLELLRGFLIHGGWSERISSTFISLCERYGERRLADLERVRLLAVNPRAQVEI